MIRSMYKTALRLVPSEITARVQRDYGSCPVSSCPPLLDKDGIIFFETNGLNMITASSWWNTTYRYTKKLDVK